MMNIHPKLSVTYEVHYQKVEEVVKHENLVL